MQGIVQNCLQVHRRKSICCLTLWTSDSRKHLYSGVILLLGWHLRALLTMMRFYFLIIKTRYLSCLLYSFTYKVHAFVFKWKRSLSWCVQVFSLIIYLERMGPEVWVQLDFVGGAKTLWGMMCKWAFLTLRGVIRSQQHNLRTCFIAFIKTNLIGVLCVFWWWRKWGG